MIWLSKTKEACISLEVVTGMKKGSCENRNNCVIGIALKKTLGLFGNKVLCYYRNISLAPVSKSHYLPLLPLYAFPPMLKCLINKSPITQLLREINIGCKKIRALFFSSFASYLMELLINRLLTEYIFKHLILDVLCIFSRQRQANIK